MGREGWEARGEGLHGGQLDSEGWEARGEGLHGGQLACEGWEARGEGLQLVGSWAGRGAKPGIRG